MLVLKMVHLKEKQKEFKDLCDKMKNILSNNISSVIVSNRLNDSPCCIVTGEHAWSANMERIMKAQTLKNDSMMGYMTSNKIMEINIDNPVIIELKNKLSVDKNDKTINDIVAQFEGEAMELEQTGLAYTCIINDEPIASAGMKIIWNGVAEGWVLASSKVWNHPLVIARAIKKNFARLAKENEIHRVQTAVRADFTMGLKFAKWLGLEEEGLMKKFGFDGSDQYMYARLF